MGRVRADRRDSQPTIVFNATPLIYLAKVGLAKKLKVLPFRMVTTAAVYREVVEEGIRRRANEAEELLGLFEAKTIQVSAVRIRYPMKKVKEARIHGGEATVIALAQKLGCAAVIDDRRARVVARNMGVGTVATPHLILQLLRQGTLTRKEAVEAIDGMIREGWRCSPIHYSQIMKMIEQV